MGAAQEEADALLIQLAQRAGGIEPLLHGVFSFLKRKTDFYHIQREGDRIGFPPGKAKRLVLEAYERFESDAAAAPPPRDDLEQRGERLLTDGRRPPPAGKPSTEKPRPSANVTQKPRAAATPPPVQATEHRPPEGAKAGGSRNGTAGADGKQDPKDTFVTYNGGECAKYRWSQTLEELVMFVDCAPDGRPLKAKDLAVSIKRKSLRVALKGLPPSSSAQGAAAAQGGAVIVEGDFFGEVKEDEVVWHLEGGRYLTVTMEKRKNIWWKSALAGDEEIDTQKVDSTCKLEDYDEGTQAAIRKIMFDQHQKMQGLPTSEELSQQDMLRKAWDAEGSPFKGTPFDPSAINFSGAGGLPPGFDPSTLAPEGAPP